MRNYEIKVYKVTIRKLKNSPTYLVDAPNKRIAKWCGANLYNNEHAAFLTARHMTAEIFKCEEE